MILATSPLAATPLGAVSITETLPIVEVSASIQCALSTSAALTVDPYVPPVAEIGVVGFPAVVDDARIYFLVSNNARATLASSITTSALSVTLTGDLSKFKDSGALTIDHADTDLRTASSSEIVYYDGKAAQVLTLQSRGQDGTTAKAWAAGAAIEARIIERHHEIHTEALIAVETEVLANKALLAGKTDLGHGHVIADVANLQTSLDGKASVSHTHPGGGSGSGRMSREYDMRDYLAGDGVTDDTAALQAVLDQVGVDKENSTLYFDNATYIIGGPHQLIGTQTAQLVLPQIPKIVKQYTIKFKGHSTPACSPSAIFNAERPSGTCLKSTLTTGFGNFMAGYGPADAATNNANFLHVEMEDMIFEMPPNPSSHCLNFDSITSVGLRNIIVETGGVLDTLRATQPTITTYGIRLPKVSLGICQKLEGEINVFGFWTGILMGELTNAENIGVWWCIRGIEFPFTYLVSRINRYLMFHTQYGIYFTEGHCPMYITNFASERKVGSGDWRNTVAEVYDPSNWGQGEIIWSTTLEQTGIIHDFDVVGGTGIIIRELGAAH